MPGSISLRNRWRGWAVRAASHTLSAKADRSTSRAATAGRPSRDSRRSSEISRLIASASSRISSSIARLSAPPPRRSPRVEARLPFDSLGQPRHLPHWIDRPPRDNVGGHGCGNDYERESSAQYVTDVRYGLGRKVEW